MGKNSTLYQFGRYTLNARLRLLSRDGVAIPLGPRVIDTLSALVRARGEPLSKEELIAQIWPDGCVEEANLTQNIYILRKTLASQSKIKFIETLPRRGYRFVPAVVESEEDLAAEFSSRRARLLPLRVAAAALSFVLLMSLASETTNVASRSATANLRLYAIGRYYWNQRTELGLAKSVKYFTQLVQKDPGSAAGFSGLADAYVMMVDYNFAGRKVTLYRRLARAAAAKALNLNPNLGAAHASLGLIEVLFDRNCGSADREFSRAIELDPDDASAHLWYGSDLLIHGQLAQARKELETAANLDALSPSVNSWLAFVYYLTRRYDSSIAVAKQVLDFDPRRADALILIGLAYEQSSKLDSALAAFQKLDAMGKHGEARALIAGVYARTGRTQLAEREVQKMRSYLPRNDVDAVNAVDALLALGKRDSALSLLRHSNTKDLGARVWLAFDPRLDQIRNDVRFRAWTNPPST